MKDLRKHGLILLVVGALAGCSTASAGEPTSPSASSGSVNLQAAAPPPLTHINLAITKLGAVTDVWLAQLNGIFAKHGLDVDLVEVSTDQSIPALQSHSADIALQIPGTAMAAREQGFDIVLVGQNETAGSKSPASNALVVGMGTDITSASQLAGKLIAVSSTRGQGYAVLKAYLERAGVPIDSVQLVATPFTAMADLLHSGQVDAAVTLDPYTTQVLKAGYGRVLSWYMIDAIPDQPVGSWWALRSWVQQHSTEVTEFDAAVQEVQDYLNADPARAKQYISQYAGLDPTLVQDMPLISWKTTIDRSVWQQVADLMYQEGELQSKHDVSEYLPS